MGELNLIERFDVFHSAWSGKYVQACRRARACRLPDLKCFTQRESRKPMTPEQETAMLAKVKRMLERRLAEIRS